MKLINATPHEINFIGDDNQVILTIAPSDVLVRVSQQTTDVDSISIDDINIPVTDNVFGDVIGLPQQQDDTVIIVSAMVSNACKTRTDLALVNQSVRDDKGRIIGCRSLSFPNK
mgnify:CR=1 FL=1